MFSSASFKLETIRHQVLSVLTSLIRELQYHCDFEVHDVLTWGAGL